MTTNHAAYLDALGSKLQLREAPMADPGPDEVLIKSTALAINPVDWKMQDLGYFIKSYPAILGCDIAGTVSKVGSNVKHLKPNDRVIAHSNKLGGGEDTEASFQEYVIGKMPLLLKLPDHVSFEEGVVLPLGVDTAAAGMFQDDTLGLALPPSSAGNGKTILIWGGSSSVGSCAIQLAVAAGYEVYTTASKHNHEYCTKLGAAKVFDYKDTNLVEDVAAALKGKDVVGAFDTISEEKTVKPTCEILGRAGGSKRVMSTLPGTDRYATAGCTVKSIFALTVIGNGVGAKIWGEYLPKALEDGSFKCKPDPVVAGKGLDAIQKGLDMSKEGVSGKKVIVTL